MLSTSSDGSSTLSAGTHAIEVDERADCFPQRIDVERVRVVRTEARGDGVRPRFAPQTEHHTEKPWHDKTSWLLLDCVGGRGEQCQVGLISIRG